MQSARCGARSALSSLAFALVLAASTTSLATSEPLDKADAAARDAKSDSKQEAKKADAKAEAKKTDAKKADAKKADAKKNDAKAEANAEAKKADAKKNDAKADAKKNDAKKAKKGREREKGPLSIGAPNRGRLVGAVRLRSSRYLATREGARTWGLPTLVQTLRRAAGQVAKKHGRSVMLVGDLSARKGGALDGHNSHQTGRDADIGFYATNSKGKPVPLKRFVEFDAAGKAEVPSWLRFDDERNWALVEALLEDKEGGVRYLFVSGAVRRRLLAYAAKKKVPKDLIARATAAMLSPRDAEGHDDHFHVRIACPEEMRGGCVEEPSAHGKSDAAEPAADSGAAAPAAADKTVAPAAAEKPVAGGDEVR